jgi:hypothetical protein
VRLPQAAELCSAMAVGEAKRQRIAYVRQFEQADEDAVRGLAFRDAERQHYRGWPENEPPDSAETPYISSGEYKEGPASTSAAGQGTLTLKSLAEVIAAALGVPVWFVMASADMENYSSSLVSESPVIQTIKTIQRMICRHFERVVRSALSVAVVNGRFPAQVLETVKIHCELPSPVARNRVDEVATDLALLDKKLKSPQHVCAADDLDFEEETELIAEAESAGWENPLDKELDNAQNGENGGDKPTTGNEPKTNE